jgi:hypothetical protein
MATKLQETFEGLLNKVSEAAVDFSELQVMTFTGDVKAVVNGGNLNWGSLLQQSVADNASLKLVAATKLDLDGDSFHYRTNATSEEMHRVEELLKLHDAAVVSSHQARQALISFVSETLLKIAGK